MQTVSVLEDSGSVEATISVLSGFLVTPVTVGFSTLSRTAIGDSIFGVVFFKLYIIG